MINLTGRITRLERRERIRRLWDAARREISRREDQSFIGLGCFRCDRPSGPDGVPRSVPEFSSKDIAERPIGLGFGWFEERLEFGRLSGIAQQFRTRVESLKDAAAIEKKGASRAKEKP